MASGKIFSFKQDRGYGFIQPDDADGDNSKNVYVNIAALNASGIDTIEVGQAVTYDLLTQDDKISAVNIKLV